MIYFSSDWHLGHSNIIKYCDRPFSSVEKMDKTILDNFFAMVQKGDTLYYLGDLSFHVEAIKDTLMMISAHGIDLRFVVGNHDNAGALRSFSWQYFRKNIYDILDIEIEGQPITLCHYPMLTFNKSHYGAWMLHGHHHNGGYHKDIPPAVMGKKLNVGVDLHNFWPISWEGVKDYMAKQPNNFDYLEKNERNHK